jgi:hypothetical protein
MKRRRWRERPEHHRKPASDENEFFSAAFLGKYSFIAAFL